MVRYSNQATVVDLPGMVEALGASFTGTSTPLQRTLVAMASAPLGKNTCPSSICHTSEAAELSTFLRKLKLPFKSPELAAGELGIATHSVVDLSLKGERATEGFVEVSSQGVSFYGHRRHGSAVAVPMGHGASLWVHQLKEVPSPANMHILAGSLAASATKQQNPQVRWKRVQVPLLDVVAGTVSEPLEGMEVSTDGTKATVRYAVQACTIKLTAEQGRVENTGDVLRLDGSLLLFVNTLTRIGPVVVIP